MKTPISSIAISFLALTLPVAAFAQAPGAGRSTPPAATPHPGREGTGPTGSATPGRSTPPIATPQPGHPGTGPGRATPPAATPRPGREGTGPTDPGPGTAPGTGTGTGGNSPSNTPK